MKSKEVVRGKIAMYLERAEELKEFLMKETHSTVTERRGSSTKSRRERYFKKYFSLVLSPSVRVACPCCHSGGGAGKYSGSDDGPDKRKLEGQLSGELSGLSHHWFHLKRQLLYWQVPLSGKSPTFTGLM